MTGRPPRTLPRLLLVAAAFLLPTPARVAAGPEQEGEVTEVREGEGAGISVMLNRGATAGVHPGQTLEVRREGQAIGYGSVDRVFSEVSVATVGTLVEGAAPLRPGDRVVFHASGFRPPPDSSAPPPSPAKGVMARPEGKVLSLREGVVLVDFGREAGLETGHEVVAYGADGAEVGRIVIELVGPKSAGGFVVSGRAEAGCRAVSQGRPNRNEDKIDFVALDFLGVVADLEHPTPHRAPCHVGVPVRRIIPGSPAQRAGIGRGDRVIAVDGIVVRDIHNIRQRVQARPSDLVRVLVLRGDRVLEVDVDFRKK